jgi:hypothetical protein
MMPTLEERLARYAAQLDDAAPARPPAATRIGRAARGPGRRVLVAALGVAAAIAIAVVIAVANHGVHGSSIGPATVPTSTVATTPPTRAETSTSTAPTTSTSTTTSATTPPPAGTREVVYQPFVGDGISPRLHVTSHLSGSCFHSRIGGHDYYRCFGDASAGGVIFDPCFAGPQGTAQPLVCPTDPTSSAVFELTATSVAEDQAPTAGRPWAIQLDGGQVCGFASAAWSGLGPYSCHGSNAPPHVADCRQPTASASWWTAACQDQLADSSPFSARRVVTVWY